MYIHNYWAACGPRVWHSWCRDILQWWRDHRLEFPSLSHPAGNTVCVMAKSAANKRVFIIDNHVVNGRRGNLNEYLIERQNLFQQCSEKEVLKFDQVSHFYPVVFFQTFHCPWNEPLNKLPRAMKRTAWVFSGFLTHSDWCRFGTETVRGGAG